MLGLHPPVPAPRGAQGPRTTSVPGPWPPQGAGADPVAAPRDTPALLPGVPKGLRTAPSQLPGVPLGLPPHVLLGVPQGAGAAPCCVPRATQGPQGHLHPCFWGSLVLGPLPNLTFRSPGCSGGGCVWGVLESPFGGLGLPHAHGSSFPGPALSWPPQRVPRVPGQAGPAVRQAAGEGATGGSGGQ